MISVYTEHLPKRVPLSQNPEFKPVRNAVIREALKIPLDHKTASAPAGPNPPGAGADADRDADSAGDDVPKKADSVPTPSLESSAPPAPPTASYALRLMQQLARIFEEKLEVDQNKRITIDRKLRREIAEKKEALGMKMG